MSNVDLEEKVKLLRNAADGGFEKAYEASPISISHEEFKAIANLGKGDLTSLADSLDKLKEGDPMADIVGVLGF